MGQFRVDVEVVLMNCIELEDPSSLLLSSSASSVLETVTNSFEEVLGPKTSWQRSRYWT